MRSHVVVHILLFILFLQPRPSSSSYVLTTALLVNPPQRPLVNDGSMESESKVLFYRVAQALKCQYSKI